MEEKRAEKRISRELVVENRRGMHVIAIMKFLDLAKEFDSNIIVELAGEKVDGKSLMELILLEELLVRGARFTVHAIGKDAEEAIEALSRLVADRFGEE